jgi:hypothetical protein
MVVAVQKGLENLADQLRQMEFEVVVFGEYQHPIDAVVYSGGGFDSGSITNVNTSISAGTHGHHGVLLVNASNKSAEEVARILRRRTYTPLF